MDGTNPAAVEKIAKLKKLFPTIDENDMKSTFYLFGEHLEDTINYLKEVFPGTYAEERAPASDSRREDRPASLPVAVAEPEPEESYVSLQKISDREYEHMKEQMQYQRQLMELCFQTASKMAAAHTWQQAKKLSDEGRKHQLIFEDLYRKTFRETFRRANLSGDSLSSIDLHGLRVQEALDILDEYIDRVGAHARMNGLANAKLEVITGRGVHSVRNIPILKPAVEKHLRAIGLRYSELEGGFIVSVV